MFGGADEDQLIGEDGRDILFGGSDADRFVYLKVTDSGLGAASDVIRDFVRGEDLFDFTGLVATNLSFVGTGAFTGGGNASIRYSVAGTGAAVVQVDQTGDGVADMRIVVQNTPLLLASDFLL